jgi:hypothetical protein
MHPGDGSGVDVPVRRYRDVCDYLAAAMIHLRDNVLLPAAVAAGTPETAPAQGTGRPAAGSVSSTVD